MIKDLAEKVFWICDQVKLKQWQEPRLYHSLALAHYHAQLTVGLDDLVKALLAEKGKTISIDNSLFIIENDIDIKKLLTEIRDFLDGIKTDKEGWGGAVQTIVDDLHKHTELFSHNYNKE